MSFIEVSSKNKEFKNSFYNQIGPKIMSRLDEDDPGFITRVFNNLSEEDIFDIFLKTCEKKGFEIGKDNKGKYWLLKTTESNFISKRIYKVIEQHAKRNNLKSIDIYTIHQQTNKTLFSLLATNTVKAAGGVKEKSNIDSWIFKDGSYIEVNLTTIKSWGGSVYISEDNFENFIANYRQKIDELLFDVKSDIKLEESLII